MIVAVCLLAQLEAIGRKCLCHETGGFLLTRAMRCA